MATITMLGAGVMASALSVPLTDNGHDVRLVGTHLDRAIVDRVREDGVHPDLDLTLPDRVTAYQLEGVAAAVDGADVLLSGVSSFGVRWASEQLAEVLPTGMPVLAIAKGLAATDDGDLQILPDVLGAQLSDEVRASTTLSAIVGPSVAGEVAVRRHTCVIFAGPDSDTLATLAELFRTPQYHVWTSTDLLSAEVCAALKNCYALGVGIAEGVLEQLDTATDAYANHNYAAALFAQGALETARMVEILGDSDSVAHVLPQVGDMYVTSTGGRNVRVGRRMGAGMTFSEGKEDLGNPTLEGAAAIEVVGAALPKLAARGVVADDEFPLLRHLYEVITEQRPVDMPWERFFGG